MSSIAVLSKPYWRWRRYRKARGLDRRPGAIAKPWNGLVLLIGLMILDLATKEAFTTQGWAWHTQPGSWLIFPLLCCIFIAPFLLIPEMRLGAAMFLAGVLGNAVSQLFAGQIANPFVSQRGDHVFAFNTADVLILTGLAFLAIGAVRPLTRRQT